VEPVISQINKSRKNLPKQLLNCIQSDTRSITGSNIRKILQVGYRDIENIEYAKMTDVNCWRVDVIKELTDVKFGQLIVDGFSMEECEEILQYACIS
jgi:hypothetical protein